MLKEECPLRIERQRLAHRQIIFRAFGKVRCQKLRLVLNLRQQFRSGFTVHQHQSNALIIIKFRVLLINAPIIGNRNIRLAALIIKRTLAARRTNADVIQEQAHIGFLPLARPEALMLGKEQGLALLPALRLIAELYLHNRLACLLRQLPQMLLINLGTRHTMTNNINR